MPGRYALQIVAVGDEAVPHRPITIEHLRVAVRDLVEMVEGDAGQAFRLVRLVHPEQIIEAPHEDVGVPPS